MLTGVTSDREQAWSDLHAVTPPGWYVGTPVYHVERQEWALSAFDTREKATSASAAGSGRPWRRPRKASCARWRDACETLRQGGCRSDRKGGQVRRRAVGRTALHGLSRMG